jgi:transposase InsO family protein
MLEQLDLMNEFNKAEDEVYKALKNCEVCVQAKSVKLQNHEAIPRALWVLGRVYMDFWGPYTRVQTVNGYKYYLSLTDDFSRFSTIYLTKDRSLETVQEVLDQWLANAERQTQKKVLVIRTDNAREFVALDPWVKRQGIELEFTEPHTPAQNGVAERLNRSLLEITRAILIDANIPRKYWPWALQFAVYIRNRTVFSRKKETPY